MKHTLNQKAMRSSPHPDTPSRASLHKAREPGSLGSGGDLWASIWHPPSRPSAPCAGISVVSSHPVPVFGASLRFPTVGMEKGRQRDPRLKASSAGRTPHWTGNMCSLQAHMEHPEKHAWASLEGIMVQCLGPQNNQNATGHESNHNTQLKTISHLEGQ